MTQRPPEVESGFVDCSDLDDHTIDEAQVDGVAAQATVTKDHGAPDASRGRVRGSSTAPLPEAQ